MPYIKPDRREILDAGKPLLNPKPGDYCYVAYKKMVDRWNDEPCWTTADAIYREHVLRYDEHVGRSSSTAATQLAWQVFFQIYVMPYELKKRDENGDI